MEVLRKKVREALRNMPRTDWTGTKPPTEHAVHSMIRNLHAAAGTKTDNSPKRNKGL